MEIQEVKKRLLSAGFEISTETDIKNGTGILLKLKTGQLINVFNTGTVNAQGKNPEDVKPCLGLSSTIGLPLARSKKSVFVVYGHDGPARTQLEAMLLRWGVEPLILDQLPSEGQTVIEKLEAYTSAVDYGVVLATPDDEGNRVGKPDERAFRARQNVVLELGMLLTKLGRSRVAILLKTQEQMERPSDIQGLIYIPFKDDLAKEAGVLLAKEMVSQGFNIDISKL